MPSLLDSKWSAVIKQWSSSEQAQNPFSCFTISAINQFDKKFSEEKLFRRYTIALTLFALSSGLIPRSQNSVLKNIFVRAEQFCQFDWKVLSSFVKLFVPNSVCSESESLKSNYLRRDANSDILVLYRLC